MVFAMFQWAAFGKVKYDNTVFSKDILISTDGDVYERQGGGELKITRTEIDASVDANTKTLLIGTGHYGTVKLTPDAKSYIRGMKVELVEKETPEAVKYYNKRMSGRGRKPKITAIIHVA